MKTLLILMAFVFSLSTADAAVFGNKRPKRNGVTKKISWQGEKKYKKHRYKQVYITKKMFAGENIRNWD